MIIDKLSNRFKVKFLDISDIDSIYDIYLSNEQYFKFCPPFPSKESVKEDMIVLPPNKSIEDKYFVGFFNGQELIGVMDMIDNYPIDGIVFIGFFILKKSWQGKSTGTVIFQDLLNYLKEEGKDKVRLAYGTNNIPGKSFWHKLGFVDTGITKNYGEYKVNIAEKIL